MYMYIDYRLSSTASIGYVVKLPLLSKSVFVSHMFKWFCIGVDFDWLWTIQSARLIKYLMHKGWFVPKVYKDFFYNLMYVVMNGFIN